ncbi:MAG: GlcG/HbpS family heme-binding protein [Acidiferrobacterales bacterium]
MRTAILFLMFCLALGSGPAVAQRASPPVLFTMQRLSMDTALRMAQVAIKACRKAGVNVAVTVVDRSGHVQVVLRDTLAMNLALKVSRDKAYTAMTFGAPTSRLQDRFPGAYSVPKESGVIISAGGLPITAAGSIIGGIGVSGSPSGVTDEKCARAGLDAVRNDIEMSVP